MLSAELARKITKVARHAWMTLARSEGYGRVDLRVDESGQPWVIEVNPCPDLSRDAGLARMAAAHGWDYETLVERIMAEALGRSSATAAASELTARTVAA